MLNIANNLIFKRPYETLLDDRVVLPGWMGEGFLLKTYVLTKIAR